MGGYYTPVILSRTQRVSGIPEKHRTIAVLEIQNVLSPLSDHFIICQTNIYLSVGSSSFV